MVSWSRHARLENSYAVGQPTSTQFSGSRFWQGAPMLPLVLAVHIWYGTYSVLDVGKPGTPHVTTMQLRWLHLIHRTPYYAKRWSNLRFALRKFRTYRSGEIVTPLIVIDVRGWYPGPQGMSSDPSFHIIGEPCNAWYRLLEHTEIAPSSASCDSANGPWPIIPGENSVLLSGSGALKSKLR